MGRSVNYDNDTEFVIYLEFDDENDDWDMFKEDIQETIISVCPSYDYRDYCVGKESCCILENGLSSVSISEYCGLVSLSFTSVVYNDWNKNTQGMFNISTNWLRKVESKIKNAFPNSLHKIGQFSNGECIYSRG